MTSTITMSQLEVVEGIAVFRIAGQCGLPDAVAMIGSAFDQAFREHHDRCLIDASALSGFGTPSVATRHQMVRRWAEAARGVVNCALVVPAELIDAEKIGVIAARNCGMQCDVFDKLEDAYAWLRSVVPVERGRAAPAQSTGDTRS